MKIEIAESEDHHRSNIAVFSALFKFLDLSIEPAPRFVITN